MFSPFAWYHNITDLFLRAPNTDDTIAFTWGQELSTSGSSTSCTRNGCQVIVAPSYRGRGGGGGGGGGGRQGEILPETRVTVVLPIKLISRCWQPRRTQNLIYPPPPVGFLFLLVSHAHSDFFFFLKLSHHICIAHAFLLNANQLCSLSFCLCPGSNRWHRTRQLQRGKTPSCSTAAKYSVISVRRGRTVCMMCCLFVCLFCFLNWLVENVIF